MRIRRIAVTTALILIAVTATSSTMFGQEVSGQHQHKTRRFAFVDIGTLGGPASYGSASGVGSVNLNNQGEIGGHADTNVPDPNAPNCFNNDCFLSHTFRWKHGRIDDLGALGENGSAFSGINSAGWIAGFSQTSVIDPLTGFHEARAVLWENRDPLDLGTFGGNESISIYVNDEGQVVGIADTSVSDPFSFFGTGNQDHTFVWEGGTKRDIGTLGGPDAVPSAFAKIHARTLSPGSRIPALAPIPRPAPWTSPRSFGTEE